MPETEKQEGQKTVVAFITGLLIGGLLVWVFSSTPETTPDIEDEEDTTEEQTPVSGNNQGASVSTAATDTSNGTASQNETGDGAVAVDDQAAGNTVALGDMTFPGENGWVVVRDYTDGTPGRILGAARYSTPVGLTPANVSLLRSTVAGSTYQVSFYSDDGDLRFSTATDRVIEGAATATFKAE